MAYDLIFGRTKHDWSCGAHLSSSDPTGVVTQAQVDGLARDTASEIVRSTNLAIKLSRGKRMPDAEKEPFRRFHKRWMAFRESRRDRYGVTDALALWNFRKLNERFKARFDVLAKVAATPLRKPAGTETTEAALVPRASIWSLGLPLWAGLAIAGVAWLGRASKMPAAVKGR